MVRMAANVHREDSAHVDTIEAIYRRDWAPLVRAALIMTGSRERAEDIVHEAFTRLAARPMPRDPSPYLRRMVVNATRDHHRRALLERRHPPPLPDAVSIPEVDEVLVALRRLPPRQRQALALRYYADLRVEDVAAAMRCPVGTTKSLIHRGIENLRREIAP